MSRGSTVASILALVWARDVRAEAGNQEGDLVYMCLRGLDTALFCAPKTMELEQVILEATLIEAQPWVLSPRTCTDEDTNPCQCTDDPSKQHWLLDVTSEP